MHSLFSEKIRIRGRWVAVMNHARNDQAMVLNPFRIRCLKPGDIHEFVVCSQEPAAGEPIGAVACLGFGEIVAGGVVEVGDPISMGEELIGKIAGFDDSCMPNYFTIVIRSKTLITGYARRLKPSDVFFIGCSTRM
jgi:hypothetical protein